MGFSKAGRPPPKKQKDRKALTRVQSISSSDFTGSVEIMYVASAMLNLKFLLPSKLYQNLFILVGL